jgi:formylmethanofuran dehydrogenase subunit E
MIVKICPKCGENVYLHLVDDGGYPLCKGELN